MSLSIIAAKGQAYGHNYSLMPFKWLQKNSWAELLMMMIGCTKEFQPQTNSGTRDEMDRISGCWKNIFKVNTICFTSNYNRKNDEFLFHLSNLVTPDCY